MLSTEQLRPPVYQQDGGLGHLPTDTLNSHSSAQAERNNMKKFTSFIAMVLLLSVTSSPLALKQRSMVASWPT
jgi:hypothetical protein